MEKINSERKEITPEEFKQYLEKMMDQDGRAGLSVQAQEAMKEMPSEARIEAFRERMEEHYEGEKIANPSSQPDKPELLELYPVPEVINENGQKELMQLPDNGSLEVYSDSPRAIPPMLPPDQPELLELYPVPEVINESGEKERMQEKITETTNETVQSEKIEVVPAEVVNEPTPSVSEPEPEKVVEQVPEPVHEPVAEPTSSHDEGRSQDSRSESGGD